MGPLTASPALARRRTFSIFESYQSARARTTDESYQHEPGPPTPIQLLAPVRAKAYYHTYLTDRAGRRRRPWLRGVAEVTLRNGPV